MKKCNLKNDYSEGAHPDILKALIETNNLITETYGNDIFSGEAKKLIKKKIKNENADIHFVSGGTQANLLVISSMLKSYQSVIAASTAHVVIHETGAIEATGHKINTVETVDGKLTPEHIKNVLKEHKDEHMVMPKSVFISNSSETGTVYKKEELKALYSFCKKNNLFLYLDGARLAAALASSDSDLEPEDIAEYTDVFYIGGTKNGALTGEAIVITEDKLKEDFRYYMKQKGALLAKSRLTGIQFAEFFKDDLYFKLGEHADKAAMKLASVIKAAGFDFLFPPSSNQIFPIFPDKLIKHLQKTCDFYVWKKTDENSSAVRLVCSWATTNETIDMFITSLEDFNETQ